VHEAAAHIHPRGPLIATWMHLCRDRRRRRPAASFSVSARTPAHFASASSAIVPLFVFNRLARTVQFVWSRPSAVYSALRRPASPRLRLMHSNVGHDTRSLLSPTSWVVTGGRLTGRGLAWRASSPRIWRTLTIRSAPGGTRSSIGAIRSVAGAPSGFASDGTPCRATMRVARIVRPSPFGNS
jgi:hypothetical protein